MGVLYKLRIVLVFSAVVLLFTSISNAKIYDGVNFPVTLTVDQKKLVLSGTALEAVTIFDIDIFVAALYLEKKISLNKILKTKARANVTLHFVHSADSKTLKHHFFEMFDKVCKKACKTLRVEFGKHLSKIPDIQTGDALGFIFYPKKVKLTDNNKTFSVLKGQNWHNLLMSFFVGKDAPSKSFSDSLLGLSS